MNLIPKFVVVILLLLVAPCAFSNVNEKQGGTTTELLPELKDLLEIKDVTEDWLAGNVHLTYRKEKELY